MVSRFFNEARAAALIEHPGMVEVYDFGHHANGSAYIVMEYLEGESLAHRLHRERKLPIDLVAALGRQIASAVGAAHAKAIVHRDLKPDNVFLVRDDETASGLRAKVLDFGIAKLAGDGQPGSLKTRTGMLLGTPYYMSPEQCRGAGRSTTARTSTRWAASSTRCLRAAAVRGRGHGRDGAPPHQRSRRRRRGIARAFDPGGARAADPLVSRQGARRARCRRWPTCTRR